MSPERASAVAMVRFIQARRQTVEEWMADQHSPGWGSSDCQVCRVPWPCDYLRAMAARWADDLEYRPEWAPGS